MIFKIKIDSEYYVLKKERFIKAELKSDKDILDNTDKDFIYFNKFINKINNTHFDKLYSYKIVKDNSKYILKPGCIEHVKIILEYLKGKYKSNYSFETITDFKDGTLESAFKNKLFDNIHKLYLMHSNDFYHTDLWWINIMYKKTNIKSIKILNFNVC